jgi:hypothetical protein
MKFIKQIVTDILMIPVIVEIACKSKPSNKEFTDENLSPYAKWVTSLIEE